MVAEIVALIAAALAGTGPAPTVAEPAARPRLGRGIVVKVTRNPRYGPLVGDARGEAFYLFDRERSSRPRCYGDCARVWPPVLARGRPVAGRGVDPRLLGTTRRADGSLQVTYRDRPMYFYVGDSPGVVLCHDVFEYGGSWLVLGPSGRALA